MSQRLVYNPKPCHFCVYEDMVVPESGETQQSVCEAAGGPTEADVYVSD